MRRNRHLRLVNRAKSEKTKTRIRWAGFFASLTMFLMTVAAETSQAQGLAGTPDPTFDGDGRVVTTFGDSFDEAFAVALQADGKIVAAGHSNNPDGELNFAVIRYNVDGSLDSTFGKPGVLTNFRTDVPDKGNSSDSASAVVIQADGKIVAAGRSDAPNGDSNFALIRYNPDGSVDTTFGGNAIFPGTTLTDFRQLPDGSRSTDEVRALAIQPDGKIVAVGFSNAPNGTDGNFALVRYNPDGSIDTSFGDNSIFPGTVLTDFGGGTFDGANAVAILPDGQIVVAGASNQAFALVRYDINGVPNTNFGLNNRVVTPVRGDRAEVNALVVQPDGQIVAVGRTNGPNGDFNFALARYNSDGTLDPTFNGTSVNPGLSITDFDNLALGDGTVERSFDDALAAAIQADGRIVAAGISDAPLTVENTNFALVRYDLNGVAITDFGTNNRVLTDFGSSTDRANAIVIQPDGLIVVAGGSDDPVANGNFNFALVRYLP